MANARLSVNINSATEKALNELAEREERTVTEVVRLAISVYKFIRDEEGKEKELALLGEDGQITRLKIS